MSGPVIIEQPTDQTVNEGEDATFTVVAEGGEGPAELWTPADDTQEMWLDASDATTIVEDVGVKDWLDKSGNGHHLDGSTNGSIQPTYNATGLNGFPAMEFDGADDRFDTVDGYLIYNNNTTAKSILIVYNTVDTAQQSLLSTQASNITGGWSLNVEGSGLQPRLVHYGGGGSVNDTRTLTPTITSLVSGGADQSLRTNGGAEATTTTTAMNATDLGSLQVGRSFNGSGSTQRFLNGFIAEVIVFQEAITDERRQRYEGYLAWKYGLEANLPVSHPYKDAAPVKEAAPTDAYWHSVISNLEYEGDFTDDAGLVWTPVSSQSTGSTPTYVKFGSGYMEFVSEFSYISSTSPEAPDLNAANFPPA